MASSNPSSHATASSLISSARGKTANPSVASTFNKYKLIRRESVGRNTLKQTPVASSNPSSHATASSFTSSACGKTANPSVTSTSSKYKLIRRRESLSRNTSKRTFIASLKDTNVSPFVPQRVVRHTPTLLVVNKYKLVRKKRHSLTLSSKRTPSHVKKLAASTKLSDGVFSVSSRNSSVSHLKARSSRYKLVRRNDQPHSTAAKKPIVQSSSNQTDDKVQVLSRYKLVRRKSATMLRTPQHVTSTPADSSQRITHYAQSLCNKHVTSPLFLNKYKLIRKRALLKTNSSYCKNFTLRSRHCLIHSRNPSAEGYKHLHSGKRRVLLETSSPYKKQGPRKQSFLSKYALQRSGKGSQYF